MKVIFLENVPNVARAGEVKEVANGYGRNFLIPQKLAMLASSSTINTIKVQHKIRAKGEAQLEVEMLELARQLEGVEVILKAKVGAKDRLYGSITSADIASELEKIVEVAIDKRKIELVEPIRQLGSYEVAIRLARDVIPKIKVKVTDLEGEKKARKVGKETKVIEEETKVTEEETKVTEEETKVTEEETKVTEEETKVIEEETV